MSEAREEFEKRTTRICTRREWKWDGKQIELSLPNARRQAVNLDYFSFRDQELVRLYSTIGSTRRILADKLVFALELNWRMPHGGVAVHDGMLLLVDTLMLEGAVESEIEASVAYLAETADQYEQSMFGPDAY